MDGKTTLIGGAITTTDAAVAAGLNKYVSKGGITTQDIENTSSYDEDAISIGLSAGKTTGKPQATMNGIGYGTDSDSDSSTTRAGITGIAGNSGITTDNQAEYTGALVNAFDETTHDVLLLGLSAATGAIVRSDTFNRILKDENKVYVDSLWTVHKLIRPPHNSYYVLKQQTFLTYLFLPNH